MPTAVSKKIEPPEWQGGGLRPAGRHGDLPLPGSRVVPTAVCESTSCGAFSVTLRWDLYTLKVDNLGVPYDEADLVRKPRGMETLVRWEC